jgi:hypothetical protein
MTKEKITSLTIGILCSILCLFLIASCHDSEMAETRWKQFDVRITSVEWSTFTSSFEAFHYAAVELPELTQEIFRGGIVKVFYKHNRNIKSPLPYVRTRVEGNSFFTETYSFRLHFEQLGQPSRIVFKLEASDAGLYVHPPCANFRVMMIW